MKRLPAKEINGVLHKKCSTCYEFLPLENFANCKGRPFGRHSYCKACRKVWYEANKERERAESRKWHKDNPERSKYNSRNCKLKKKFGLSFEDYQEMHLMQEGLCAICKRPSQTEALLAVDHDHITGKVRALLCASCNMGIGQFDENVERMEAAIAYIKEHRV